MMEENSNSSILSVDGKDPLDEISPKRNAKRTAKVKVKTYGGSDDEDLDQMDENDFDNEQSDYRASDSENEKKIKKSKSKAKDQVDRTSVVELFLLMFGLFFLDDGGEKCIDGSHAKSSEQRRIVEQRKAKKSQSQFDFLSFFFSMENISIRIFFRLKKKR